MLLPITIFPRCPMPNFIASLIAAILMLAGPAGAAEPTRQKPKAANKTNAPAPFVAKPIEPVLTRDQLRDCMSLQARNKELGNEISRLQTEVTADTDAIKHDAEALRAELAALDRSNIDAVNAYNQHAVSRNQLVANFETKVADFNAKAQSLNDGRAAYARDCENRRFDERDEKALLKGS